MKDALKKIGLYEKLIYTLGGFLIGMLVIATFLKVTSNMWGVLLGFLIDAGAVYYLLKKNPKRTDWKLIAYGILVAIIFTTVTGVALWSFVSVMFQGIAG